MSFTVEQVVQRHRELTGDIAVMKERHALELEPLQQNQKNIEAWLLAKMNQDGIQNYKTPHGTAYQSKLSSVKLEDAEAFRGFVMAPAAYQIVDMVSAMGGVVQDRDRDAKAILGMIGLLSLWDLADIKPGKKGILKYQEDNAQLVPGISFTEIVNINVRGS